MRNTAKVLCFFCCLFLASISFADSPGSLDFSALMGQTEKIFPEKYDEKLAKLYRPEDRLVFIFREMTLAHYNEQQEKEAVLNGYLKKALNRYWLLESNEFKHAVEAEPEYYLNRIIKYLEKLPNTYDQAAFSFLFAYLKEDFPKTVPLAESTLTAVNSLNDDRHLKAYCTAIAGSRDFYKKIPLFLRPFKKVEDKVDALINKLQQKFILEKMILALDAVIPQSTSPIRSGLLKLKDKLSDKLLQKILANLKVQLETGLEENAVTAIRKNSQGIIVSQVLYQGRIRTFVKQMQKAETKKQLKCFLPIVKKIRKGLATIKTNLENQESLATLDKMDKNLDQMTTILSLKLRNKKESSSAFKKLVKTFDQRISGEKTQKLLSEL